MCLCTLGNILDVGAEGTVQGGDVWAVGTVVQKDVVAFGTVDQKDVVAFGTADQKDAVPACTIRKCWFCPGKESVSAVSYPSSVISPGIKGSDPVLKVGDFRCAGDIPPGLPHHARTSIRRVVRSVMHCVRSEGAEETFPVQHGGITTIAVRIPGHYHGS